MKPVEENEMAAMLADAEADSARLDLLERACRRSPDADGLFARLAADVYRGWDIRAVIDLEAKAIS